MNRNHAPLAMSTAAGLGGLPPWVRLIEGDGTGQGAPPVPTPPPPAPPAPAAGPEQTQNGPNGYPEGTPIAAMTPEQQAAYWRTYARRHEDASKAKDAEIAALKPKAEQLAALEEASKSEAEKAVTAAEQRGRDTGRVEAEREAVAKYGAALVAAKFETALTPRGLTTAQVETLMSGLNVTAFLGADGLPDTAKITEYAAAIPAPATGQQQPPVPTPPRDLGGGRTTPPPATGTAAGRALYAERHKKPV